MVNLKVNGYVVKHEFILQITWQLSSGETQSAAVGLSSYRHISSKARKIGIILVFKKITLVPAYNVIVTTITKNGLVTNFANQNFKTES